MGISQHFRRASPASEEKTTTTTTRRTTTSPEFLPLFASNAILSILSITNLALISSMVAWLLKQKHNVHSYKIDWPGDVTQLNVLPKHLLVNQGHESNGVAGYGFFLGVFGMITAWRLRKAGRPLKSLSILTILHFLAILFTFSALVFTFVVTNQTKGQHIREPVAANEMGSDYSEYKWTPETWMKAVLDLPLADGAKRKEINSKVTNMAAWRWILIPLFFVNLAAFGITLMVWLKQRKSATITEKSAEDKIEK